MKNKIRPEYLKTIKIEDCPGRVSKGHGMLKVEPYLFWATDGVESEKSSVGLRQRPHPGVDVPSK